MGPRHVWLKRDWMPAKAGIVPAQGDGRSEDTGMKILVFFRWAKKRITVRLEIRFRA